MNAMDKKRLEARKFFMPKLPELPKQCASCPFLPDNDKEWSEIIRRLGSKKGVRSEDFSTFASRMQVHFEVSQNGEFMCHSTVYNPDMTFKDPKERRQCPGATKHYKENLP